MIKFYFNAGPNPMKVALFLEESGLPYEAVPVDIVKGHQHQPEYRRINPNGKVPSIVDGEVVVFDSNAILLYLAEKSGQFWSGATPAARGEMLSWLMFVASGVGPYSGQAVHFKRFAPEPKEYALNRYAFEAERHFGIVDARLATRRYMLGSTYTLVDMALWGWARVTYVLDDSQWAAFPHLARFVAEINARLAAQRAIALTDRFSFKSEVDDDGRKQLFPGLSAR